jgi:allantoicase
MIDPAASFTGLVDLASASLGGRGVGTSDDFFAGIENLLLPGRGVFVEGKFTERGKWMDGWESRRKRVPGHDWCVLELGAAGRVLGLDIDTNHFVGNAPAFASADGVRAPRGLPLDELQRLPWVELLAQSPLRPGSQNLFTAAAALAAEPVSHVRLNIFPDGGVARFRVFGRVQADWAAPELDAETAAHVERGMVDLAAVKNGGLALACSDAFFGPMNNLLLPGRAENMGGGWETRRRRGPGHDWILLQLGARGVPAVVELDTSYFKGNYPERASLEWIDAPGGAGSGSGSARITDLVASSKWSPLLPETKLEAHTRHFFREGLAPASPATHVRVNIFPDGGLSRVRIWGARP